MNALDHYIVRAVARGCRVQARDERSAIAEKLLQVLYERMWFRRGPPDEGWALEQIKLALEEAVETEEQQVKVEGQVVIQLATLSDEVKRLHELIDKLEERLCKIWFP